MKDFLSEQEWHSLQESKAKELVEKVGGVAQIERAKYSQFQNTYRDDWVAFVHDCIDWERAGGDGPAFYQEDILGNWTDHKRQAIRGPRTLGKTALAAWCVLAFALTNDGNDWKALTTASTWSQLEDYLWPELHKWSRLLRWDIIGREPFDNRYELQKLRLRLSTGMALAVSSDDPAKLEGAHSDNLFFVFDEAKIIPTEVWDSFEGTFAGSGRGGEQFAKVLAISTPGEPAGRFFDIHRGRLGYEDWHTIHITREDAIKSGRMTEEWAEQRRKQWGEDSQQYHNHVLGEFKEADVNTLIPMEWVEQAMTRWDEWQRDIADGAPRGTVTSVGCDIGLGGEGGDNTVIAICHDDTRVFETRSFGAGGSGTATMEIAGRLKGIIDAFHAPTFIDVIGIGVGVLDRLREQGYTDKALPFNAAEKTALKDKTKEFKFQNKRAAMWWLGREMFDPNGGTEVMIPRDTRLLRELTTPKFDVLSNAVIKVESKKDIRKRLKRSTDVADAVLQALVGPKLCMKGRARVWLAGQGYIT